jgi:hypothetical protein
MTRSRSNTLLLIAYLHAPPELGGPAAGWQLARRGRLDRASRARDYHRAAG